MTDNTLAPIDPLDPEYLLAEREHYGIELFAPVGELLFILQSNVDRCKAILKQIVREEYKRSLEPYNAAMQALSDYRDTLPSNPADFTEEQTLTLMKLEGDALEAQKQISLGLSYGGTEVTGTNKRTGAAHIYNTKAKYLEVPRPDSIAEFVETLPPAERMAELQFWIEAMRIDWMKSKVGKRDWFAEYSRWAARLDEQTGNPVDPDGGYFPDAIYGPATFDIRASEPDLSKVEVLPPIAVKKPKYIPASEDGESEDMPSLSPGD